MKKEKEEIERNPKLNYKIATCQIYELLTFRALYGNKIRKDTPQLK